MSKFLYKNGLPFNGRLPETLDKIMLRIQNNKAAMIVIDGASGEGKTTLGVEIVNYIHGYYFGRGVWIDYKAQYAMGGKDFHIKLRISKDQKKIVVIYDEAGDFSNRNFASNFNRMLQRVFEAYRTFKILVICILPVVGDLDNGVFKLGVVRLLINCHSRKKNYGCIRAYSLYRTFYLKDKMKKLTVPRMAYRFVRPNFKCYFKNLPPGREKELDLISTKGKDKTILKNEIAQKGLITFEQMEDKLHKGKNWVREKVKKLNIKPTLRIGQRKFFNKSALFKLENLIYENQSNI